MQTPTRTHRHIHTLTLCKHRYAVERASTLGVSVNSLHPSDLFDEEEIKPPREQEPSTSDKSTPLALLRKQVGNACVSVCICVCLCICVCECLLKARIVRLRTDERERESVCVCVCVFREKPDLSDHVRCVCLHVFTNVRVHPYVCVCICLCVFVNLHGKARVATRPCLPKMLVYLYTCACMQLHAFSAVRNARRCACMCWHAHRNGKLQQIVAGITERLRLFHISSQHKHLEVLLHVGAP